MPETGNVRTYWTREKPSELEGFQEMTQASERITELQEEIPEDTAYTQVQLDGETYYTTESPEEISAFQELEAETREYEQLFRRADEEIRIGKGAQKEKVKPESEEGMKTRPEPGIVSEKTSQKYQGYMQKDVTPGEVYSAMGMPFGAREELKQKYQAGVETEAAPGEVISGAGAVITGLAGRAGRVVGEGAETVVQSYNQFTGVGAPRRLKSKYQADVETEATAGDVFATGGRAVETVTRNIGARVPEYEYGGMSATERLQSQYQEDIQRETTVADIGREIGERVPESRFEGMGTPERLSAQYQRDAPTEATVQDVADAIGEATPTSLEMFEAAREFEETYADWPGHTESVVAGAAKIGSGITAPFVDWVSPRQPELLGAGLEQTPIGRKETFEVAGETYESQSEFLSRNPLYTLGAAGGELAEDVALGWVGTQFAGPALRRLEDGF
jgi:hypothetical protein